MNFEVAQSLFETDSPAELAYYMGKHPDQANQLATMTPMRRAIALGRIEATMQAQVKKSSKAPDPIKPIGTSETTEKTPATMSNKEYRQWSLKNRRSA